MAPPAASDVSFDKDKSLMRTEVVPGHGEEARDGSVARLRFSVHWPGDGGEQLLFDSDSSFPDGLTLTLGQTLRAEVLERGVLGAAPGAVLDVICVDPQQARDEELKIEAPMLSEAARAGVRELQMREFADRVPSFIDEENRKFAKQVAAYQPPVSLTRWHIRLDSVSPGVVPVLLKWPQDRLDWSTRQKDWAQQLLQKGQPARAARRYKKAMLDLEIPTEWDSEQLLIQRNKLRLALHLNIALCALKTDRFDEAIWHTSRALLIDPKNVKALYRRGCAHLSKPDHPTGVDEALNDLSRAAQLDPSNREVASMLAKARALQKAHDKESAGLCSRMLTAASP